jgi:hypothetical protein
VSTLRLYAAPLVVIAWALLVDVLGNTQPVVVARLVSSAVGLTLSIREIVTLNRDGRRGPDG